MNSTSHLIYYNQIRPKFKPIVFPLYRLTSKPPVKNIKRPILLQIDAFLSRPRLNIYYPSTKLPLKVPPRIYQGHIGQGKFGQISYKNQCQIC